MGDPPPSGVCATKTKATFLDMEAFGFDLDLLEQFGAPKREVLRDGVAQLGRRPLEVV